MVHGVVQHRGQDLVGGERRATAFALALCGPGLGGELRTQLRVPVGDVQPRQVPQRDVPEIGEHAFTQRLLVPIAGRGAQLLAGD